MNFIIPTDETLIHRGEEDPTGIYELITQRGNQKITRKIKIHRGAAARIARRKATLIPFGAAVNNTGITTIGDEMAIITDKNKNVEIVEQPSITGQCRNCGGPHWTYKCSISITQTVNAPVEEKVKKYVPAIQQKSLRIYNLPNHSEKEVKEPLYDICEEYGEIARLNVLCNSETQICKGTAFVTFKTRMAAERAFEGLHKQRFIHSILNVDWAND